MRILIIIPAHNEEIFIEKCINSLLEQHRLPAQIVIVNDNSTDKTEEIIDNYSRKHPIITKVNTTSSKEHLPGSKVVQAFENGLATVNLEDFDLICKYDADLIFPKDYLETISKSFENAKVGMASGYIYEYQESSDSWELNHPMNKEHIRGALKAYSVLCFTKIGGLKNSIGWDTVDELLALYYGFEVKTIDHLHVKHLRPTGNLYNKKARKMQGEAMYKMRYGFTLTFLSSLKMALAQKKFTTLTNNLAGYFECKRKKVPYMISDPEGTFIRQYRYNGIFKKLKGK